MKVLLDTNVILDVLLERKPYLSASSKIFSLSAQKNIQLFVTATIVTDLYYIVSKLLSKKKARDFLVSLLDVVDICGVEKRIILDAIKSNFSDFEDAVQYFAAKEENIERIVTRNKKDFRFSTIKILTPAEFVKEITL